MVDKLTTSILKEIVDLPKRRGQQKLAKHLEWKVDDEDVDLKSAIHLDYLYDNIMFAGEKGFPWDHISLVVQFAESLLHYSLGKELIDILKYIQTESTELGLVLGERNFKAYIDFLFSSFLQHVKLFQYVFTNEREKEIPCVELVVQPPKDSGPMKQAKEVKIWEYQQNYESLQRQETEKQNERLLKKEKLEEESEKRREEMLKSIDEKKGEKFTKETITDILKDVIGTYTANTIEKIKWNVDDVKEDLEFKLQKTSLPRPQQLGAPPRFTLKPKTPGTAARQTKTPKSPSPSRKKSGSAKTRAKAK